jgi:hypothetical protein
MFHSLRNWRLCLSLFGIISGAVFLFYLLSDSSRYHVQVFRLDFDPELQTPRRLSFINFSRHGIPIYLHSGPGVQPKLFQDDTSTHNDATDDRKDHSFIGDVDVLETHPRLFAREQKWAALPRLMSDDPYLGEWNDIIFRRAEELLNLTPVNYRADGTSGALDVAREVQLRIKHWAYAYCLSKDIRWKERIYQELLVASGNSTSYFGIVGDHWNSQ